MRLDDLDDRFVPRLAARLGGLVDAAVDRRRRVRESVARLTGPVLEPAAAGPLRRLDDRYASSGPLALLRDVPQLGMLLVAAVFLAGAGVALARSSVQQRAETTTQQQIDDTAPTALGPEVGSSIDAYVAASRKRAVLVSQGAPDDAYTALVTFSKYVTPEQARQTIGGLQVQKVVLHAHLPSADVLTIAVKDLVPEVRKAYADIAKRKAADAAEFTGLGASIVPKSDEETQFKAFYASAAAESTREAKAYSGDCACIIAALVRGKARELAALPALAGVRAVELGGRSEDEGLVIRPLAPEQQGIVKKIVTPSGGTG